ncbi:MAG: LlaJI family restriction endonuclease [Kiritimatiellae bacterium]|nr:LlaJI family restriction endonuclease [Kiritimatiellia bacterium]
MPQANQHSSDSQNELADIFQLSNTLFFLKELQDENEVRETLRNIVKSIELEQGKQEERGNRNLTPAIEISAPVSDGEQTAGDEENVYVKNTIKFLRDYGLLKSDNDDKKLRLKFVGLIELRVPGFENNPRLIFVEPKFFEKKSVQGEMKDVFKSYHKNILKAILKYGKVKDKSPFSSNQSDDLLISDRLWKWLVLLWDWMEHGTYLVEQALLEENGEGEIDWVETIAQKSPFLQNKCPIYMEYLTQNKGDDPNHYITRLHECMISQCYKKLDDIGLADTLGLFCENFYEGELSDFGEVEYILSRLNGELGNQFITAKRRTLTLMKTVIKDEFQSSNDLGTQFLGMQGFHTLWEEAIKEVYGDQLDQTIEQVGLRNGNHNDNGKDNLNPTLAAYIKPPHWNDATPAEKKDGEANRLRPDFLAIKEYDGNKYMIILDAKYYLPEFITRTRIKNQPGVGDVNKQFLYQLAYKGLVVENNLLVRNAFLFPKDDLSSNNTQENSSASNETIEEFATINVSMFKELFKRENEEVSNELFPTELKAYKIGGLFLLQEYALGRTHNIPRIIFETQTEMSNP